MSAWSGTSRPSVPHLPDRMIRSWTGSPVVPATPPATSLPMGMSIPASNSRFPAETCGARSFSRSGVTGWPLSRCARSLCGTCRSAPAVATRGHVPAFPASRTWRGTCVGRRRPIVTSRSSGRGFRRRRCSREPRLRDCCRFRNRGADGRGSPPRAAGERARRAPRRPRPCRSFGKDSMKRRHVGVSKLFLAGEVLGCLLLVAQVNVARAQTEAVSAVIGLPDDWTHHHVLFPDSLAPEVREALQRDPRYWLHQARRKGEALVGPAWSREIPLRGDRSKKKKTTTTADWSVSLG